MKKISIFLFVVMTLCAVSIGFAADDPTTNAKTNAYYSTKHPQSSSLHSKLKAAAPKPQFPPATDIVIYNRSNNVIFAIIPNSPVNDVIFPGEVDHIYHDTRFEDTYLVLQDADHHTFFSHYVCNHAKITVNAPSYFNLNVSC